MVGSNNSDCAGGVETNEFIAVVSDGDFYIKYCMVY
jgi:hypothetical protein